MTSALSRGQAVKLLVEKYGFSSNKQTGAPRVLDIAQEFGRKASPCKGGFVHVVYVGNADRWPYTERFTVHDHVNSESKSIATPAPVRYTSSTASDHNHDKRKKTMPPARRPRAARPAPEPEVEVSEPDVTRYLTKAFTPTMQDYVEWAEENIGPLDDLSSDRLLVLGSQLYPKFAASEFNITRREARKAERAASNGEDEEPAEAPARTRRTASTAAKPARARRAAAVPVEEPEEQVAAAPARPARRGRKPAAAAAPY